MPGPGALRQFGEAHLLEVVIEGKRFRDVALFHYHVRDTQSVKDQFLSTLNCSNASQAS